MSSQNFIFLESFKRIGAKVGNKSGSVNVALLFFLGVRLASCTFFQSFIAWFRELLSCDLDITLNKTNGVSMNNSMILTSNSEVVCY
jgi:hypothetical protein